MAKDAEGGRLERELQELLHGIDPDWWADPDDGGGDDRPAPPVASDDGFVRLSEVPDRPGVEWIAPGWLAAGKAHLLAGDPGVGKTTLAFEVAARMSAGEPALPGAPVRPPTGVLLVCPEDGLEDTVKPRLRAAGADLDRVFSLHPDDPVLLLPAQADRLRDKVVREGIGLVVVDPLPTLFPPGLSINDAQAARLVMQPLAWLGNATGATTLLVQHLNKVEGRSAAHRIGGTTAVLAVVRLAHLVGQDPADPGRRVLATVKNNLSPFATSLAFGLADAGAGVAAVHHLGTSGLSANALCAAPAAAAAVRGRKPSKLQQATALIWKLLDDGGGEVLSTDLDAQAEGIGISKSTVRKAREQGGFGTHKRPGDGKQVVTAPEDGDGAA